MVFGVKLLPLTFCPEKIPPTVVGVKTTLGAP